MQTNNVGGLPGKLTSLGLQNFHRPLIVTEPAAGLASGDTMNIVLSSGSGTANDGTVATGAFSQTATLALADGTNGNRTSEWH